MAREPVPSILSGLLLDEQHLLTLAELCRASDLHAEALIMMVEEGLLEPLGRGPREWRFPASTLRRVHTVLRLQRDLDLDLRGAALAVDLLDEVRELRARVRALEAQLRREW